MVMAFESLKEMVIQNPLGLQKPQKAVKLDHDSTGNGFHESPQLSPVMILEFPANSQFERVNSSLPYARIEGLSGGHKDTSGGPQDA